MAAPRPYPILTDEQKRSFWKKVDRGPAAECWLWTRSTKGRGYGAVRINKRALSAHRVAWEIVHGPVPAGLMVYQDFCNNPACCNPAHMKVGTKSQAMLAASRHGTRLGRGVGFEPSTKAPRPIAKPYPVLTEKQVQAFWAKVDKDGPDGCWVWTAAMSGYGRFRAGGRSLVAHRVSFGLVHGDPPTHLDVCHSCDNIYCVNPDHLFLGTRKVNMLDCTKKDRHNAAQGVAAGKSKLVPEQVYEIRRRYDAGEGSFKIAKDFGITGQSVGAIGLRRSWKHLPEVGEGAQCDPHDGAVN